MGNYVTPSTLKAAEGMAKYSDAALLRFARRWMPPRNMTHPRDTHSVFICLPVSAEEPQVAGEVRTLPFWLQRPCRRVC